MLQARVLPSAERQQNNFSHMLKVIQEARKLPSPPAIVARLTELLADPEYKNSELVSVVTMDPAIAAEALNLANSALYTRASGPVETVQKAIETIGDRQLMQLLVARAAMGLRSELRGYNLNGTTLWRRSLTIAVAAGYLARRTKHTSWSHAYTVGLLMDIGHLAMGCFLDQRISDTDVDERVVRLDDVELHLFGLDHAELGRRLTRTWGLPPVLTQAIGFHHRPADAGVHQNLAYIVHGADALTASMYGPLTAGDTTTTVDNRWMQVAGVAPEDLDAIKEQVTAEVGRSLESLNAKPG